MGAVPTFTPNPTQADLRWWMNGRPFAFMYQTNAQTGIPTTTWTPVQFNTTLVDRDSGWPGGTSGRYTIGLTNPGYFLVSGMVAFAGAGGSMRAAKLVQSIGGTVTDVPGGAVTLPGTVPMCVVIPPTPVHSTAPGDYVELQCFHDVGATSGLAVTGGMCTQMFVAFEGQ